jgi:hypothetical protein
MIDFDREINDLIDRLNKVPGELPQIVAVEINQVISEVEDLNIAQLQSGINSKKDQIKPDYTDYTKAIKQAKGQPTNRVTLKDEGDFYKSIAYKADAKGVEYKATDIKTTALEDKYGEEILGLTDDNIGEVVNLIENEIADNLLKIILN